MKALVVYDTNTGCTEKIALAISVGMKEAGIEAVVRKADDAKEEDFKGAEAWVVGAPTHIGSATGPAKKALKRGISSGTSGKRGTTFDTRFESAGKGGMDKLRAMMEDAGIKIVVPPEWFKVMGMKGPVTDGEEAKANAFGHRIAAALGQ